MTAAVSMPLVDGGLRKYLAEIRKFPLLEKDEEYMLAKRWREHEDAEAAHRLVTSHLRLSAKIALGYRGYGLPIGEMISEGNLGLMHAVKRFDPDLGFRLSTYAMWWIRAAVQEYILRSWSLVKVGTNAIQKKLFFKLRRAKAQISALTDGDLAPDQVKAIAAELGVEEGEVVEMDRRLASRDASLNSPLAVGAATEWVDLLEDTDALDPEAAVAAADERRVRMQLLEAAMDGLNPREKQIFAARRLQDPPRLLEDLAKDYGVTRERVRQIEVAAFAKVRTAVARLVASGSARAERHNAPGAGGRKRLAVAA